MGLNKIKGMIVAIIGAVIFIAVGVNLGPTVFYYSGWLNSTSLENVTLGCVIA